jgi:hypothetical protein
MKVHFDRTTGVASIFENNNCIGTCENLNANISYSMAIDSGHGYDSSGKTVINTYTTDNTNPILSVNTYPADSIRISFNQDTTPANFGKIEIYDYYKGEWITVQPKIFYETNQVWQEIKTKMTLQDLDKQIDRVLFHEPATIILWKDKTKTVVKAQNGEPFDKEKGFLMALAKRLGEDKGNYNKIIKKWCETDEDN